MYFKFLVLRIQVGIFITSLVAFSSTLSTNSYAKDFSEKQEPKQLSIDSRVNRVRNEIFLEPSSKEILKEGLLERFEAWIDRVNKIPLPPEDPLPIDEDPKPIEDDPLGVPSESGGGSKPGANWANWSNDWSNAWGNSTEENP